MISPTQFVGRERAVGCDVGNRQMVFLGCVDIRNSPECPMTARCKNKRGDCALSFRYTRRVGCMVEVDGNWLPEANVEIHPWILVGESRTAAGAGLGDGLRGAGRSLKMNRAPPDLYCHLVEPILSRALQPGAYCRHAEKAVEDHCHIPGLDGTPA
jgi:hypothetical protein